MKTTLRKTVAFVLMLAISVSGFAINASAYLGQEISVGETVSSDPYDDFGIIDLVFTPSETGVYVFYSMGDEDTVGYVMDTEYNVLAEGDDYEDLNFYILCYLTAGETYFLQSQLFGYGGDVYSVCIEKTEADFADEIFIFHGGETTGYVDNYLYFECLSEPEGAFLGNCTWESDNEDVAIIEYSYQGACDVYFTGVGTANITVTTEFGLTDTIQVKGIEIPEIQEDTPEFVSFGTLGGVRYFKFTAKEAGMYAAYGEDVGLSGITVYDSEWNYISSRLFSPYAKFDLATGEFCCIEVSSFIESPDFDLVVTRCVPAEGIEIVSYNDSVYYEGMTASFEAVFAPELAEEDEYTWSVSDETVASVETNDYFGGYCDLVFKKAGKITLTVTSDSGLTDSIDLECIAPESIALNETMTCSAAEQSVFKFVPEKSGTYVFLSEGDVDTIGYISDKEWYILETSDNYLDNLNFAAQYEMEAGETYYLSSAALDAFVDEKYTVKITEATAATKLTIDMGTEVYGYVGDTVAISCDFGSNTAQREDCTFTSSNEEAVVIDYSYSNIGMLYLENEGVSKITVTTESGLSAEITVHVSDISYTQLKLS